MKTRLLFVMAGGAVLSLFGMVAANAGPPPKTNPQQFDVHDETQDGLQTATDPDIGNVRAVANPGGQDRVIIQVHIQHAAPNCTLSVDLVRDSAATNGGLSAAGHTGFIQPLGTLTTNGQGNGNFHFDGDLNPASPGTTQAYGHIDLENYTSSCTEDDATTVQNNEYGAAPDPALQTPFTWYE